MKKLILTLFVFLCFSALHAKNVKPDSTILQDSTKQEYFELKDGSEIVGTVTAENDSTVAVRTISGIEMVIPRTEILKRYLTEGIIVKDQFWFRDPNDTRTFLAPTGRGLKGGQGYLSDVLIIFPSLAIGITDHFSLMGGTPILGFGNSAFFYFAPKISPITIYGEGWRADISAGAFFAKAASEDRWNGITYLITSVGKERGFFTVGLGTGFKGSEFDDDPLLLLSAYLRVSKYTAIISENWIPFSDASSIISFGLRYFGRKFSADLAFIIPAGKKAGVGFMPWLGVAYNFGN